MKSTLVPPRDLGARTQWAQEHPWVAGVYFGFVLSVAISAFEMLSSKAPVWFIVVVGVPAWALSSILFSIMIRRRFGQRPDADRHPLPTGSRPWTRASDRFLRWFLVVSAGGVVVSVIELVTWSKRPLASALSFAASAWLFGTLLAERRRRSAGPSSN